MHLAYEQSQKLRNLLWKDLVDYYLKAQTIRTYVVDAVSLWFFHYRKIFKSTSLKKIPLNFEHVLQVGLRRMYENRSWNL